jgi:heptosyltransferase-2
MVDRAVKDLHLDLSVAYVVGDQSRDVELARRIGARSVLMLHDVSKLTTAETPVPDHVASSLADAVDWILEDAGKAPRPLGNVSGLESRLSCQ